MTDISNKIYSFVVNPSKTPDFQNIIFGNQTLNNSMETERLNDPNEIESCSIYKGETLYLILSKISTYGLQLFCGLRAFTDYVTQYVN